jgi:energy-coupling factor transport system permease protein
LSVITSARVPRTLHPGAWWLWALALATAASQTTNPVLLAMILAVAGFVVAARRTDAPWALGFRLYLYLGAFVLLMRVIWRVIFGGGTGDHVLFVLPEIPLPAIAAGIRLFGPVTAEQVLGGFYDGLRLAAMLVCVGAANALANPKRLLKALPSALYEIGAAVVVALSVAPQLIESVLRVRRARRLRAGREKGIRALRGIIIPVLEDAMDRSLSLAAAMDARGYGRVGDQSRGARRATGVLVLAGLIGVCAGLYGVFDGTMAVFGTVMLACGLVVAVVGFVLGGRRTRRTRYRPDRIQAAEILVAGSGVVTAALMIITSTMDTATLYPSLSPLSWPEVAVVPVVGILIGVLPAWLAPLPVVTRT